jgi:hypothetical protein
MIRHDTMMEGFVQMPPRLHLFVEKPLQVLDLAG